MISQAGLIPSPVIVEDEIEGLRHTGIGRRGSRVLSGHAKGKGLDADHIGCATAEGGSLGLVLGDRERLGAGIVGDPVLRVKGLAIYRGDNCVCVCCKSTLNRKLFRLANFERYRIQQVR